MDPVMGQGIVIAVLSVIVFACGRSMIRNIMAELRGEKSCAGCSGCSGCGGDHENGSGECRRCMRYMEELKKKKQGA